MTELMKRYEKEFGVLAAHNAQWTSTHYTSWVHLQLLRAEQEIKQLKDQLRWRPVSEKPENDDWVTLRRIVNGKTDDEQVWFYHLMDVKEWEGLVKTLGATHWLPIPPAMETTL